jgi:hypothetical protein
MSSAPFQLGLKVVDDFKYNPPFEGAEISFVMRGKDEKDTVTKLIKILDDVPDNMKMLIYHIGFRPDKPTPVARYFIEVEIDRKDRHGFPFFWHGGWSGRKKAEEVR